MYLDHESFYLTKEQYEGDINYLKIIYEYYKLSDYIIERAWIWGKYPWVKKLAGKDSDRPYRDVCSTVRKIEMYVRTILYDKADDIKRYGDRVFAN